LATRNNLEPAKPVPVERAQPRAEVCPESPASARFRTAPASRRCGFSLPPVCPPRLV